MDSLLVSSKINLIVSRCEDPLLLKLHDEIPNYILKNFCEHNVSQDS
jgi:hypothetical protein